jgi:hypothetical protein
MSYLFVTYLWEKKRFAPQVLVDTWDDAEPRFAGEELTHVAVNPRVEAAFYFAGNFSTKSEAFSYGSEAMLMDGWAEAPAEARREAGDYDFRYIVWLSSDMFEYDVVLRFEGNSFEGRALIDGQGERVSVVDGVVTDYELADTTVDASEFGADGDNDENFDEDAYHKAVEAREKPFWPGGLVHETLGVDRQKVILALHKAWDEKGKALWPKGGAQDTSELRKALESGDSFVPALPLWGELGEQFVPAKKTAGKKGTSKKRAAKKKG